MARKRIPAETIQRIEELLAAGDHTHAEVASACGVSRKLVGQVARGERSADTTPGTGERVTYGTGVCYSCNELVELPCLACELLRMLRAGDDRRADGPDGGLVFGLELDGEEPARYLEVRAIRERSEAS